MRANYIMKLNFKKLGISLGLSALLLTGAAFAVTTAPPYPSPTCQGPVCEPDTVLGLIGKIGEWISTIFWILAVVFILFAGITYMTAQGDPEKVKTANQRLLYGIIAIVVGLIAYGLPKLVEAILKSGGQ